MKYTCSPTWEDIIQVPGKAGIKDTIKNHHEDGGEEGVSVLF